MVFVLSEVVPNPIHSWLGLRSLDQLQLFVDLFGEKRILVTLDPIEDAELLACRGRYRQIIPTLVRPCLEQERELPTHRQSTKGT